VAPLCYVAVTDVGPSEQDEVTERVASFYEELPFNYLGPRSAASLIRERNQVDSAYPDLDNALRESAAQTVLDVGCGTGWFSNTCAYHYGCPTLGIDLSTTALELARATSVELGIAGRATFARRDLFELGAETFDIVVSIGVLHHTHDLRHALEHATGAVAAGGRLYLGLYHAYGRRPFLELFERYRKRNAEGSLTPEELEEGLALYQELNPGVSDREFLRSWFRDQVLHPHETQHTLAELQVLLDSLGFEIQSTGINGFLPFESLESLFERERELYEHSRRRNVIERRYFPGFFTVLAQPRR
jgi:SAM-dependent methyltransferase